MNGWHIPAKLCAAAASAAAISALVAGCSAGRTAAMPPRTPPKVTVQRPLERRIVDYGDFSGRVQAVETVEVRARVDGYLDSVDFTEGEEVEAGQLLFVIDPRPYEAALARSKADIDRWTAQLELAKVEVRRYDILSRKNAGSREDLDKAAAQRDEASASLKSAEAAVQQDQLNLDFTRVTAPIPGRVSRALVTKGNLVTGNAANATLLTTIVRIDPMYVYFDVDERSLLDYQDRQRAGRAPGEVGGGDIKGLRIPAWLGLSTEEGYPHEGTIDFTQNVVDAETGTFQIRAVFPNADRALTPGLFARVRVRRGDVYPALLVPEVAIGTEQGEKYVLIVDGQGVARQRRVVLGPLSDDNYRAVDRFHVVRKAASEGEKDVVSGLEPGDRVIVNGMLKVQPNGPVEATEEKPPAGAGESLAPPAEPAADRGATSTEPAAEPEGTR